MATVNQSTKDYDTFIHPVTKETQAEIDSLLLEKAVTQYKRVVDIQNHLDAAEERLNQFAMDVPKEIFGEYMARTSSYKGKA